MDRGKLSDLVLRAVRLGTQHDSLLGRSLGQTVSCTHLEAIFATVPNASCNAVNIVFFGLVPVPVCIHV